jgi:hypothetical protein
MSTGSSNVTIRLGDAQRPTFEVACGPDGYAHYLFKVWQAADGQPFLWCKVSAQMGLDVYWPMTKAEAGRFVALLRDGHGRIDGCDWEDEDFMGRAVRVQIASTGEKYVTLTDQHDVTAYFPVYADTEGEMIAAIEAVAADIA